MSVKYIIGQKYFWVRIVPGLCVALMHPSTPRLLHWRLLFFSIWSRLIWVEVHFRKKSVSYILWVFQIFSFLFVSDYCQVCREHKNKKGSDIAYALFPILHRVVQTRTNTGRHDQFQGNCFACFEQIEKGDFWDRIVKHGWWGILQRPFCCTICCDALLGEAMRGQTVEIFNDLCNWSKSSMIYAIDAHCPC